MSAASHAPSLLSIARGAKLFVAASCVALSVSACASAYEEADQSEAAQTASSPKVVTTYPELESKDPYRYSAEEERQVVGWFVKLADEMLAEKNLQANASQAYLTAAETAKYSTLMNFDDDSIKLGERVPSSDARLNAPFFDRKDLEALGGKEGMARFRKMLEGITYRVQHRDVTAGEAPSVFIGESAEDDLAYTWPSRELGGNDGIYLNLKTKAVQFIRMVRDMNEQITKLESSGKLKAEEASRLRDGGQRFLLGFILHELFHAHQFAQVPVRNLNQAALFDSMVDKGEFKHFGDDFISGTIGASGGVDKYIEKSLAVARKEVTYLRELLLTAPSSARRVEMLRDSRNVLGKALPQSLASKDANDVWKYVAAEFIQKKSMFFDSLIKSEIYEIEGFGLNRVLLKGHERSMMDFAYLVDLVRTDDWAADTDLFPGDLEGLKNYVYPNAAKALTPIMRPLFIRPTPAETRSKAVPFNLLRWEPSDDHLGNDPVSYYMLWDAYMSWTGFGFEPPVDVFMKGYWVPIVINHRMAEISTDKSCSAELKAEAATLKTRSEFYTVEKLAKLNTVYTNIDFKSIKSRFDALDTKFHKNCP